MDKTNYLSDDFKQMSQNADDTIFELLKAKEKVTATTTGKKNTSPEKHTARHLSKANNSIGRRTSSKGATAEVKIPKTWGKPTAILNTRIPQELSDKLDDHVYQSKKKGKSTTKQATTIAALTYFLESSSS